MAENNKYIIKEIASHRNEKILVIDDQAETLKLLKLILKDYQLNIALSAKEGLEHAIRWQPDLIILDIMMPEVDGFEAFKMLKANEMTKDIPIIFVSARVMIDDVIKGLEMGANDYVTKPFEPAELIARINIHLDLQKAKRKLLEQYEHLLELNEAKDKFLQIAAHDLRNPLKVIQGFTKLILDRYDTLTNDSIKEFICDIFQASEGMLLIINDILTINDLEEERYELIIQDVDLTELLAVLKSEYDAKAKTKDINIEIKDSLKDKIVRNDLLKIKQILENLLSNAITYSHPHTTVSLIAENIGDSDLSGEYFAKLTVRDQGPGIPEDELPHIFDKFCKISNKPTGNEVSSGMGLAIAKKLSSITHTNLVCETQRGKGSDFILYLPKHLEVPKNEE